MKTLEASGLVHGGHPCIHLSLQQSLKTYRYNLINLLSIVRTPVTVLCKSNASEMHEFRSLLPRLIDESSLESSSDNSFEQRAIFLRTFVKLKKIREHKR